MWHSSGVRPLKGSAEMGDRELWENDTGAVTEPVIFN